MAYGSKAAARRQSTAKPSTPQFMPVPPVQAKPTAQPTELPDIELDPSNYQIDLANPLGNMYGHPPAAPPPVQPKPMGNATHHTPAIAPPPQAETVQREGMEEEEEALQMQPLVQRVGTEGGAVSDEFEQQLQSAKGSGQALDADLQQSMGQAMGADFSGVKVHTDAQSDQLNESIQSKAFTTGADVFFRAGEYDPGSKGGQELIAHELTHVVQQGGAGQGVQRQGDGVIQRFIVGAGGTGDIYSVDEAVKYLTDSGMDKAEARAKAESAKASKEFIYLTNLLLDSPDNVEPAQDIGPTTSSKAEVPQQHKYLQIYQSKNKYFEIQNNEISAYFKAIHKLNPNPDYLEMTPDKLTQQSKVIEDSSLKPRHWATALDPARSTSHAEQQIGKLLPVLWPENCKQENKKAYRGDTRPPWHDTLKDGFKPWSMVNGETYHSKNIYRHIALSPSPTDSVYTSTTVDGNIANTFGKGLGGYTYQFKELQGLYVPNILKGFPEQELAVPNAIPSSKISSVSSKNKKLKGKRLQKVIESNAWDKPIVEIWPQAPKEYAQGTWKDYLGDHKAESKLGSKVPEPPKEKEDVVDVVKDRSVDRNQILKAMEGLSIIERCGSTNIKSALAYLQDHGIESRLSPEDQKNTLVSKFEKIENKDAKMLFDINKTGADKRKEEIAKIKNKERNEKIKSSSGKEKAKLILEALKISEDNKVHVVIEKIGDAYSLRTIEIVLGQGDIKQGKKAGQAHLQAAGVKMAPARKFVGEVAKFLK
jgi:hypothetical protein